MRVRTLMAVAAAGLGGALGGGALTSSAADDGPSAAAAAAKLPGPLYGVLLGRNEIAADGTKRAGDTDGRGSASATIDEGTDQLCFGLTVKDIGEPVGAHIHRGNRGRNGPVVVALTAPSDGDPGASSGCVDIEEDLAKAISKNPHKYYWNVHTEDFPAGALRGQVFVKRK